MQRNPLVKCLLVYSIPELSSEVVDAEAQLFCRLKASIKLGHYVENSPYTFDVYFPKRRLGIILSNEVARNLLRPAFCVSRQFPKIVGVMS